MLCSFILVSFSFLCSKHTFSYTNLVYQVKKDDDDDDDNNNNNNNNNNNLEKCLR